ncbi:hypothetical protein FA15DRAFT_663539 [Coprinopsis marcescibilis]|uniref:Uncharacterized protein n=1 Tax=Coprinopsis marcescibilis TaxID=230819 RepID=A0A5C3LC01_COPMA|nr:hypothetical protein FA15DRAFT_663539 [Coprinopsis marcescibilis]
MADYSAAPRARALKAEEIPAYYLDDDDDPDSELPYATAAKSSKPPLPGGFPATLDLGAGNKVTFVSLFGPNPPQSDSGSGSEDDSKLRNKGKGQTSSNKTQRSNSRPFQPIVNLPKPDNFTSSNGKVASSGSRNDKTSQGDDSQGSSSQNPLPPTPNLPDPNQGPPTSPNPSTTAKKRSSSLPFPSFPFYSSSNSKSVPGSFTPQSDDDDDENEPVDSMSKRLAELATRRRKEAQQAAAQKKRNQKSSDDEAQKEKSQSVSNEGRAAQERNVRKSVAVKLADLAALRLKQNQHATQGNDDTLLEEALDELGEVRDDRDRLATEKEKLDRKVQLLMQQVNDYSQIINQKDKEKSKLRKTVKELSKTYEEPLVMRDRLDQANFKLRKAERRNRYVDDSDRWKADAKYRKKKQDAGALLFGFPTYEADAPKDDVLKERRGAQGLIAKSVEEVVGMMKQFNHGVFNTSAIISDFIFNRGVRHASVSTAQAERARKVLGPRAVKLVLDNLPETEKLKPLLAQFIMQIFLVFWCNSIIEAWYPKQATFAEFLVDICSKIKVGDNRNICGTKTMITQTHTRDSVNLFSEWVQDILDDLHEIISVFGWTMKGYDPKEHGIRGSLKVRNALLDLVKEAYDLRTAMAEVSTSGDVDLAIISCDTPFKSTFMDDECADQRTKKVVVRADTSSDDSDDDVGGFKAAERRMRVLYERVVGTTGLGLQREVMKPHPGGLMKRDIDMVLKPRVVLEQSLLEALDAL